ncbi:MAG: SIMPL domain-containing protein [Xanthomonadaceae bacterium]|nr:SIMPL domain-containing protein [Xanthomonadaceae bacterium]
MSIKNILLGIAIAAFTLPAIAENDESIPMIVVSGIGEVNAQPDEMLIVLRIEKFDKDLQAAKRMNDDSVQKIMSLTRKYSIPARDIETSRVAMEMIRAPATKQEAEEQYATKTGVIRGYSSTKTMIVKLSDISRFDAFYEELLQTGLSEISSIQPATSKLYELRSTARELAMNAARDKATAMAGTIGQSIGKAVRITENRDTFGFSSNSSTTAGNFTEESTLYAPGAITVRVSVTVSFELK